MGRGCRHGRHAPSNPLRSPLGGAKVLGQGPSAQHGLRCLAPLRPRISSHARQARPLFSVAARVLPPGPGLHPDSPCRKTPLPLLAHDRKSTSAARTPAPASPPGGSVLSTHSVGPPWIAANTQPPPHPRRGAPGARFPRRGAPGARFHTACRFTKKNAERPKKNAKNKCRQKGKTPKRSVALGTIEAMHCEHMHRHEWRGTVFADRRQGDDVRERGSLLRKAQWA